MVELRAIASAALDRNWQCAWERIDLVVVKPLSICETVSKQAARDGDVTGAQSSEAVQ